MSNNSGSNTSKMAVPQAKEAMNRFKQEVASEIGVPLKEGYNGDLTSAQAGSIGGEMVKKMIMKQEQQMSGGQQQEAQTFGSTFARMNQNAAGVNRSSPALERIKAGGFFPWIFLLGCGILRNSRNCRKSGMNGMPTAIRIDFRIK